VGRATKLIVWWGLVITVGVTAAEVCPELPRLRAKSLLASSNSTAADDTAGVGSDVDVDGAIPESEVPSPEGLS
jgi:hypothetical protein